MKLKPIFVNENSSEGLHAICYDGESLDEFERLFNLWNDTKYVKKYCVSNEEHLQKEHFDCITIDQAITKIKKEAEELEDLLYDYAEQGFEKTGQNLQMLFKPLHDKQYIVPPHQETKALIVDRKYFPKPILRIYAIRIGPNTFVVTGGAIKLTKAMEDHNDTTEELKKLEKVKTFLKANQINIEDDLIYYYEQQ